MVSLIIFGQNRFLTSHRPKWLHSLLGIVLTDDDYGGGRGLSLHPRASPLIAMRGVGGFVLTMELVTSDRRRPTRKSLASRAGISNGA